MNNPMELPTSREDFQALINYMFELMRITDLEFETHLFSELKTKIYTRPTIIQEEHKLADKTFFIAKGMVFAFFYDKNHEIVAFRLYNAGEIVLIPESFLNGKSAEYSLMACGDTRLLELTFSQLNNIFEQFPQSVMLSLQIISSMVNKDVIKNKMLSRGHETSISKFYETYPDLFGNISYGFRDKYISRYLNITPVTFSRLRKKLFPKYPYH